MNNGHLSASQRRIHALERELELMKQMQVEYNVFLNYVVGCHGVKTSGTDGMPLPPYQIKDGDLEREFVVYTDRLKTLPMLAIRTEISKDGKTMTITRVPATLSPEASRIIRP